MRLRTIVDTHSRVDVTYKITKKKLFLKCGSNLYVII